MIYEREKQITFNDIDANENMSLIALLRYMTEANWGSAEELGIGVSQIPKTNLAFVTQRIGMKIFRLPTLGENFKLRTWPSESRRLTFVRKGEMLSMTGEKLIEWESLWVLFNIHERKIKRPTDLQIDVPLYESQGVVIETEKIKIPDLVECQKQASYKHLVDFSDLDSYKHMSNTIYGNLLTNVYRRGEDKRPLLRPGAEIQFNYLNEGQMDQEVVVSLKEVEKQLFIVGETDVHTVFTAKISYEE